MTNEIKGRVFTAEEVLSLLDKATVESYDAGLTHAADLLLEASKQANNYSQFLNQLAGVLLESIGDPLDEVEEVEEVEGDDVRPSVCNLTELEDITHPDACEVEEAEGSDLSSDPIEQL